jgi:selenocysteine lyase/cysteine desulfurase
MNNQKHLFNLTENIHYLNCAYMSPLLASVEEAGKNALVRLRNPSSIKPADFFSEQGKAKELFGRLINGDPSQVAIIPSVSYGLKTAITNIPVNSGTHAIMVYDEFPSDYYALSEWCKSNNKQLKIIHAPEVNRGKGKLWNEAILDAIQKDTSAIVLSSVHWMNGTRFDLEKIGERCRDVQARFIVDGSQSVGVLPIDVTKFKIDALVCTGYKWLFGPYSIGLAYFGDSFKEGRPIEDSWMNRANADDFTNLTGYTDQYTKGAGRFNVGESSHFILLPMLIRALEQVLEWQELSLQTYCGNLIQPLLQWLRQNDFALEEETYRVNHLFGIALPEAKNRESLLKDLQEKKIVVSVRSNMIRVSTHLFNTGQDVDQLLGVLQNSYKKNL